MIPETRIQFYKPYHFGSSVHLTGQQMHQLAGRFDAPRPSTTAGLEGRNPVSALELEGVGPVVIKHYRRGGLPGRLIKHLYLRQPKTRGQQEYELLQRVRQAGVQAPQPVAFAFRGRLFYRAWLITRQIQQSRSLARISLRDESRARHLMPSVAAQILRLVDHRIHHVDLHPGNVIIDPHQRVFLLDFDRGRIDIRSAGRLKHDYAARWRRAVSKHRLPQFLSEMLDEALKINVGST